MNDTNEDDDWMPIPEEIREIWGALQVKRAALFKKILNHLCTQHGYGELSELDDETGEALVLEAEELVEKYDEDDLDGHPLSLVTDLWQVVREHHEVCESIMNYQDDMAIGRLQPDR